MMVKLKSLRLKNIKSYEDETITFYDGVNFISGINGAGKSTIIESIGYALFDAKPGVLNEFVRYGAKTGVITLEFEAADERLYRIVRKVGNVSSWVVYDGESGQEIDLHGAADIKPWLKNILGLEQDQDLAQLFTDVVGVSQGTFTAPFLDRPADRKQKFNRMLQVESYNEAYLKTREVNSFLQDKVKEEENKRERLLGQIEGYEECIAETTQLQAELADLQAQTEARQSLFNEKLKERDRLRCLKDQIQQLSQSLSVLQVELKNLSEQRAECLQNLSRSREAARIADQAKAGYEQYVALQKILIELEQKSREKARLERQYSELLTQLNGAKAEYDTLESTLKEQNVKNLEQLNACKERLDELQAKIEAQQGEWTRLEALSQNVQKLWAEIKNSQQGPQLLDVLSNRVQNGLEKWRDLKTELENSERELRESANLEQQAQEIKKIQEELQKAKMELAALWEKARSLRESKEQVQDGLCPHLHEPCRNVQGNLADYFAKKLEETSQEVADAEKKVAYLEKVYQEGENVFQQLQALELERERLAANLTKEESYRQTFKKIWLESLQPDLMNHSTKLLEASKTLLDLQQKASGESTLTLPPELSTAQEKLLSAWREYRTGFHLEDGFSLQAAEELLNWLVSLSNAGKAWQIAVGQFSDQVRDRVLAIKNTELNKLNELMVEQRNLAQQATELERLQEELKAKVKTLNQKKAAIGKMEEQALAYKKLLQQFDSVEQRLEKTREDLSGLEESYRTFLKYQEEAQKVTDLEKKLTQLNQLKEEKLAGEKTLQAKLEEFRQAYSSDKLNSIEEEVEREREELSKAEAYLKSKREKLKELQKKLESMEEIRKQIALLDQKLAKYGRVKELLDYIRSVFNRAGEKVATVYREYLAQEASRIYREVSRENVALEWQQDYEVVLVDQLGNRKRERCFRQLSGGEQMTAALAVRLALLKQLSGINVGFFDEPTTNLDGERRSHLASVIPQITQSFDQLFIISHDDSFDAMTDNVIELSKDTGAGTKLKQIS